MAHYRHFMKTRLSVKQHIISISQMTLYYVTRLKMNIWPEVNLAQIDLSLVMPNYVLCSRPQVRTIVHKLSQLIDVVRSYCFGNCESSSNTHRNSKLIKSKIWVWGNHSSCRKVNSFAHQVSSQSTLFAFETWPYTLYWFPTFVFLDWLTCDFVVHQSANIILKHSFEFFNYSLVCTFFDLLHKHFVSL